MDSKPCPEPAGTLKRAPSLDLRMTGNKPVWAVIKQMTREAAETPWGMRGVHLPVIVAEDASGLCHLIQLRCPVTKK